MKHASESRRPRRSLRSAMTLGIGGIGALTLVTAVALVTITSVMNELSGRLQEAAEAVHGVDLARTGLLIHSRTEDAVARFDVERTVRRALTARPTVLRGDRLEVARAAVEAYLVAVHADAPAEEQDAALARAHAALGTLSEHLAAAAAAAQESVDRWDHAANLFGTVTATLLVAAVLVLSWWVRQRAFRPLLTLADAMSRFAAGDLLARAPAVGPSELAGMAAQFNAMADTLARRRESQLAFLAGVAHDLRNPLSAIRLAVGTATPRGALPPETKLRSTLGRVDRQVERLQRILTDLVEGARVESGHLDLRVEAVDLRSLCAETVALFADTSREHSVLLEDGAEAVTVRCDPVRIEQVLVNLLSNAIKYSPSGGRVAVEVRRAGRGVELSVADEGIGITPGEEDVIFEPFRRSARVLGVPGSGLGLFAVKRIVESHGGAVRVERNPGGGSTFVVALPPEPQGDSDARSQAADDTARRPAAGP